MQSMDSSTAEELAALRRRAYGRDADIVRDPVALARLRELEAWKGGIDAPETSSRWADAERLAGPRPALPVSPAPAVGSTASSATAPAAGVRTVAAEGRDSAEQTASPPASPPSIGRAVLIGWAASILVVAVAVGALVFGLASLRPVSAVTGARQVASLDEQIADRAVVLPWMADGDRGVSYRFAGLLIIGSSGESMNAEGRCLTVVQEIADNDGSRMGNSTCSAGPFHPAVSILVTDNSSDELRNEFPVGTALQFVWDGTAVSVFAVDPPAPTNAPA